MTVTYGASPLAFSNVAVGSSKVLTVTVRNETGATIWVSSDNAAFSTGGSIEVADAAEVTVTVTFTPTAAQAYNGTLSSTDGSDAGITLTGTGVDDVAYDPTSLSYGTLAVGSSATMTVDVTNGTGSDVTVSSPNATYVVTGSPVTVAAGTTVTVSIVFTPSATGSHNATLKSSDGSDTGIALSGAASDVTTNDDTDYYEETSYTASSQEKVALLLEVPDFTDASATVKVGGNDFYSVTGGLKSYLRLGAVPSNVIGYYQSPTSAKLTALGTSSGEDLASLVTTFLDDGRSRGTVGTDPNVRMTTGDRATETGVLHTRGGWRDHTDGNRITTTRGDKVEVIGGNYKLIVLGRSNWSGATLSNPLDASGGLHHESSGGITYHYDQVPGQIVDVTWEDGTDGTFRIKEQTLKGHFVVRYEGEVREWVYGTTVEERIGSYAAYELIKDTALSSLPTLVTASDLESGWSADDDFDTEKTDSVNTEEQDIGGWPPSTEVAPDVMESTWAETKIEYEWALRIAEYKGSSGKRIPSIKEYDYANTIDEKKVAGSITETVDIRDNISGVSDPKLEESAWGKDGATLYEKRIGSYKGHYDGPAGELWGFSLSGGYHATNFGEFYLGGHESFRVGWSVTCFAGGAIDLHVINADFNIEFLSMVSKAVMCAVNLEFDAAVTKDIGKIHNVDMLFGKQLFTLSNAVATGGKYMGGILAGFLVMCIPMGFMIGVMAIDAAVD